jgi:uncharacterized protein (TIGR02453 family)
MPTAALFRPAAFTFLGGLKRNNTKAWFEAHRDVYEREVREPMKALVEELDVRMARIAPEIIGSTRRSLFRIHRDIRFSKDKSPYKTNAGLWLYHGGAGRGVGPREDDGSAGFYFHLATDECFAAGGIWMPSRPQLNRIRAAIADHPDRFAATVSGRTFRRRYGELSDEAMLTRLPRGFAPGHPAERWLRHQSFTASAPLTRAEITGRGLPERLAGDFRLLVPMVRWLNAALGHAPRDRR